MPLYVVPTDPGPDALGHIGPISHPADPAAVEAFARAYETNGIPCLVIPGRIGIPGDAAIADFQGFPAAIYRAGCAHWPVHRLARHERVVITGPGVPAHLRINVPCGKTPPVVLDGGPRNLRALPVDELGPGNLPYGFGNAFLWSPDSRWSQIAGQSGPIPLHDYSEPA
ncbi:hypothetical protein [Amycolatopsis kentuckyensis]|uniref:hypothetical protein n=1 Tax=Amycolatopsis kentuckyensis TaxID=218823 RepID=UPI00356138C9